MGEKLLTLKEAAASLGISENDLERLVEKGAISAYHIGGKYLRFKEEQITQLKPGYLKSLRPYAGQEGKVSPAAGESLISRVGDFFYFNDFYILSAVLAGVLVYIILESIR